MSVPPSQTLGGARLIAEEARGKPPAGPPDNEKARQCATGRLSKKIPLGRQDSSYIANAESVFKREMAAQPMLEPGEDIELAKRYRDYGDETSLDRLICSHLRLVGKLARSVKAANVSLDDLVAEGCTALTLAARSFDPDRGYVFAAYAKTAIIRAMRKEAKLKQVELCGEKLFVSNIHLDDVPPNILQAPCEYEDSFAEFRPMLAAALPGLDPRERELLSLRYGGDEVMQLRAVGKLLGISGERVRQLESRAFEKIREASR